MRHQKIKLIFLLLSILNLQIAFSQSEITDNEFVEYSEKLALRDYKRAVDLENSDSLIEAIKHYKRVAKFAKSSELKKLSNAKLDSIWKVEKEIFQNQFTGEWRWIWSGNNWGTADSPKKCNCQKYWKVDTEEILVIEDDQVKERLTYKILKDINRIGTSYFLIHINAGEKEWRLRIYREIENAYYLSERSKDAKYFLSFRDEKLIPNCACGCPEKRFEKK